MTGNINHKYGSIRKPGDLLKVPGYSPKVDFSESSGRRVVEMLDGYEFSKEDEYPCGIKACATKHQFGYLIKTSDGIYTNIGNRCGKKHLDLDFDRVKKEYKSKRKAFDNANALADIRSSFDKIESRIRMLELAAVTFKRFRSYLYEGVRSQLLEATSLAKAGQREVFRTRRMSKREASIHYEITKTSSKDYDKRRPTVEEVVCRISGGRILKDSLEDLVRIEIREPLKNLIDLSDFSFSVLTDKELESLSLASNKAVRAISSGEQLMSDGLVFYGEENLSNFSVMGADKDIMLSITSKISNELREVFSIAE
ncbi:hypothetical protein HU764_008470 [Pseudomonas sp. SWRI100]|uniref:hypothetical protein n=1 Tax=Pseudomonas TaxID=286 RepID=UPI0016446346|nr:MULTISPECIES: hypothetical protein [Pseudomonas]MBC3496807.1 hypothetical protein [Pseudomonas sp. SWRI67]MBV4526131.1 hypothetical protein [Pseudomonas kermanshahensis]